MISIAVTGVEINCSMVPRSHSRAMVSEVRNAPMTDITSARTPGMMKALLSRSSLYQVRVSTLTGAGWIDPSLLAKPVKLHLGGVSLHHRLGIADQYVGRIVICRIHERLHLDRPAGCKRLREVPRNHDPHLGVAVVQRARNRGITIDHPSDLEVPAVLKVLEQVLALLAAIADRRRKPAGP